MTQRSFTKLVNNQKESDWGGGTGITRIRVRDDPVQSNRPIRKDDCRRKTDFLLESLRIEAVDLVFLDQASKSSAVFTSLPGASGDVALMPAQHLLQVFPFELRQGLRPCVIEAHRTAIRV